MTAKKIYTQYQKALARINQETYAKGKTNAHLKTKYFELKDIWPSICSILLEHSIIAKFGFTAEYATLDLISTEDESIMQFTSPMPFLIVNMLGGTIDKVKPTDFNSIMQAIGAQETYQRRYLLLAAFGICEDDKIEKNAGKSPRAKVEVKKKDVLSPSSDKWDAAIEYLVKNDKDAECLRQHYEISDADISRLTDIVISKRGD